MSRGDELNAIARRAGYSSYYQYRNARAKAEGFAGYAAARKARATDELAAARAAARRGVAQAPRLRARQEHRPRAVETPAGKVVTSSDASFVRAQLRQAAQLGQRVAVFVTVDRGEGPRSQWLTGQGMGGVSTDVQAALDSGDRHSLSSDSSSQLVGKPQLVIGDAPGPGGRGFDPRDLLDAFDAYDWDDGDWYDWLVDYADEEYFTK